MNYVTFDPATGALTGAFLQPVEQEHAGCNIEVTDDQRLNWNAYRANATRDGVEPIPLPAAPTPEALLEREREATWSRIKVERDRRKGLGVRVAGKWFHSDDGSRIQQLALVLMGAGIPVDLQWKTLDGTFVTMTQALAGQILGATAANDQGVFACAELHKAAMAAAESPMDYDFSKDWPVAYGAPA